MDERPEWWGELPPVEPDLLELIEKIEALFDAFPEEDARKVGDGFYYDADMNPRTRYRMLRAVREPGTDD